MDREMLARVLTQAPGVDGSEDRYEVTEDHRLTFYLGYPGQEMQVGDVIRCALQEGFVELTTREDATVYVTYETVHGVASRPARARGGRAGFL